jgi:hypothetical protein
MKEKRKKGEKRKGGRGVILFPLFPYFAFPLLLSSIASMLFLPAVAAQKKPKPALSAKQARSVIASLPGFKLKTGAIKVREVSPAGASPVSVVASVKTAFRLAWVEDERVEQTTGIFKQKRWRAEEFRTGDREWDDFGFLAESLGAERLESVRGALEALVAEFEAQLGKQKSEDGALSADKGDDGAVKDKDKSKEKDKKKPSVEPLTRGPLTIESLSSMGSSAVAEVSVEASFHLSKDARGKWRVEEILFGDNSSGSLEALWQSVDAQKAARVRADLSIVRDALEAYRRERGFYVVAEDLTVLMDHLSPRFIKRIVRIDPWHNPYRYTGTVNTYVLGSDGPDGKTGTSDDVTLK